MGFPCSVRSSQAQPRSRKPSRDHLDAKMNLGFSFQMYLNTFECIPVGLQCGQGIRNRRNKKRDPRCQKQIFRNHNFSQTCRDQEIKTLAHRQPLLLQFAVLALSFLIAGWPNLGSGSCGRFAILDRLAILDRCRDTRPLLRFSTAFTIFVVVVVAARSVN